MFCPKCRAEYDAGIRECADCALALVEQQPPAPPHDSIWDTGELVTLLSSTDPVEVMLTKASLDLNGIRYYEKGKSLQNLLPLGFKGGFTGLIEILVLKTDAAAALAALQEASPAAEPAP